MSLTTASKGEPPNGWISKTEAAALMGVDAVTLEHLRKERRAPTWALLRGTMPIYRRADVQAWVKGRGDADRQG